MFNFETEYTSALSERRAFTECKGEYITPKSIGPYDLSKVRAEVLCVIDNIGKAISQCVISYSIINTT